MARLATTLGNLFSLEVLDVSENALTGSLITETGKFGESWDFKSEAKRSVEYISELNGQVWLASDG